MLLRDLLPNAYGVATGEIIPYIGEERSPQCDIIIYDQLKMPIIGKSDAVQQVPLEAVYAVIECKSRLDKGAITDASAKFSRIRALPRCESKSKLKKGMSRGPYFFLFGYRLNTSSEFCVEFAASRHKLEDTLVSALDAGNTIWIADPPKEHRCVWLPCTNKANNLYETLAIFYVMLLSCLSEIDLGNPPYITMFLS